MLVQDNCPEPYTWCMRTAKLEGFCNLGSVMLQNIVDNFNTLVGHVCRYGREVAALVEFRYGNFDQIALGRVPVLILEPPQYGFELLFHHFRLGSEDEGMLFVIENCRSWCHRILFLLYFSNLFLSHSHHSAIPAFVVHDVSKIFSDGLILRALPRRVFRSQLR